jgi:hypothetical protein
MNILEELNVLGSPTGSRYICNPPIMDTDDDYLIYAGHDPETIKRILNAGFITDSDLNYQSSFFTSFRRDKINLIVTHDLSFYANHIRATQLCKKLNLLKKSDRIAVFQAILYGNVS